MENKKTVEEDERNVKPKSGKTEITNGSQLRGRSNDPVGGIPPDFRER